MQTGFWVLSLALLWLMMLAIRRSGHSEIRARILEVIATAARRGLALAPAVERLARAQTGANGRMLQALADRLANGSPIGTALEETLPSRMVPAHVLATLRSVEGTPGMRPALAGLAESKERVLRIHDRVSMALAYPSLLAVMMIGLYITTETLLGTDAQAAARETQARPGTEVAAGGAAIVLWAALAFAFAVYLAGARGRMHDLLQQAIERIPPLRRLLHTAGCARMLRTAANLTSSGVPLATVLERAAPSSGVPSLVASARRAATLAAEGTAPSDVWQTSGLPPFASAIVSLSAGSSPRHLARRMRSAAATCDRRVERVVDRAVSVLQPATVLFFGGLIAIHFATVFARIDAARLAATNGALPW